MQRSALPPLLPEPRTVRPREGALRLRPGLPIVLGPEARDTAFASACALRDALARRAGLRLPIETHARREDLGACIALAEGPSESDAYWLEVSREGAVLRGEGPAGLRHACQTFAQLADRRARLPACSIEDAPDFAKRGLMLDVSRGKVPDEATLRGLVDLCERLKLNVLMLYVEHTFAWRRHPELGEGSSPLEAETLRGLDAYAAERHVELVPCLQSLGHMERLLSLERYRGLDESDRGWTLSPEDPASYALLGDLYAEFLPNFRSPLFNANCDEPYDLGRGRSEPRARSEGRGRVFLEHVRRVRDLAGEHGKRTLVWADVLHQHPELAGEIDRDLVMLDWWYEAGFDFDRVKVFPEHGLDFWVCPGTSSWNCLYPRIENALANIAGWAEAGQRHGAQGLLCTDWGDFGHYNLQGQSLLPFAWAAQQAWSGEAEPRRFDLAFGRALFGDASGRAARLMRELGAIHDAGFVTFNGSPLQYLFFDDLAEAPFAQAAREGPLRRSARRLETSIARIEAGCEAFGEDALSHAELLWAARATHFAAEKGLAARGWLAWRARPGRLDARARRALARRLAALAERQHSLGREWAKLWNARARPSNRAFTERRIARSIRSLRSAARALERNRPPPPPEPLAELGPSAVLAAVRAGAPTPSPAHPA